MSRRGSSVTLVYDDTVPVPAQVAAVTGVRVFGSLLSRRRRLRGLVAQLAEEAGCDGLVHLQSPGDVAALSERLQDGAAGGRFLLVPSNAAPTASAEDVVAFLRKLLHLRQDVAVVGDEGQVTGVCLLGGPRLRGYLTEGVREGRSAYVRAQLAQIDTVPDRAGLVDLQDQATFVAFLSSSFAVRHFNAIEGDRFVISKRSADKDKMRREARFYELLPPEMQPFFVQPYGYEENASGASYSMRRLYIPDVAVQWVHHAFSPVDFERFLDQALHVLEVRPLRPAPAEELRAVARSLYVTKLQRRLDQLLAMPEGQAVDAILQQGGVEGGVRGLFDRYTEIYDRLTPSRRLSALALTHGDMCFSNMLYSQASQFLQLIDPRGADQVDELYSDDHYDVAKLSHSVLGSYDFINAGLFEVRHGDDLSLHLDVHAPDLDDLQQRFVVRLEEIGFDVRLVRLYEASLFLSMLPLHIDVPKKVLAFALRARDILTSLNS